MNSWIAPVYGALVSLILGYVITKIQTLKRQSDETAKNEKLVQEALAALLRSSMYRIYRLYYSESEIPQHVQSEMKSLWEAYHALGYNHEGDVMYSIIMEKTPIIMR